MDSGGDAELPTQGLHFLVFQQAGYEAEAPTHLSKLVPGHLGARPQMPNCAIHLLGTFRELSVDGLTALSGTLHPATDHQYPRTSERTGTSSVLPSLKVTRRGVVAAL